MEIPTGYGQMNLKFTGAGVPSGAEVTHGFKLDGSSPTPTDAANSFIAAISASPMEQNWRSNIQLSSVLVKFGPNATGPSAEVACAISGTYTASGSSPASCFLIHKQTASGGHAGKGRMYWPGVPEAEYNDAGEIASATVTAVQTDVSDMFDLLDTLYDGLFLLHGPGSPLTTPTKVTGWNLDPFIATQRRRLRR